MRLDQEDDCPLNRRAKIYLDGVEQKFCTTVDDVEGWIVRYVQVDGRPATDPKTDTFAKEQIAGRLVIIDPAFPGEPLDKWRMAPKGWQDE